MSAVQTKLNLQKMKLWRRFAKFVWFVLLSSVLAVILYLGGIAIFVTGGAQASGVLFSAGLFLGLFVAGVVCIFSIVLGFPFWMWSRKLLTRRGITNRFATALSALGVALIGAIPIIRNGWIMHSHLQYPNALATYGGMVLAGMICAVVVALNVFGNEF